MRKITTDAHRWRVVCCLAAFVSVRILAQTASPALAPGEFRIVEIKGTVEFSHGNEFWDEATLHKVLRPGDLLRTGEGSRASVFSPDVGEIRLGPLAKLEIPAQESKSFNVLRGLLYFFHRGRPGAMRVRTPTVSTLIRGTEFNLKVGDSSDPAAPGITTLTLIDGEVEMTNAFGATRLVSGQQATAATGEPPRITAVIYASNVLSAIQWTLYYPAVLDVSELELPPAAANALQDSISAGRQGDLPKAYKLYPQGRRPESKSEAIYLASLLLSVGEIEKADQLLDPLLQSRESPTDEAAGRTMSLAQALKRLADTVRGRALLRPSSPLLATEWLAESYAQQSRGNLAGALDAARNAVQKSPSFSFGWARVAELQLSFGRHDEAQKSIEKALTLAPRNAQALALRGFLLAAASRTAVAEQQFNDAIATDSGLANAWLGRGLCRIHNGEIANGIHDLEIAAALEPSRGILRSYLGKAFALGPSPFFPRTTGDATNDAIKWPGNANPRSNLWHSHATNELALAKRFDPADPTPWLYSALLNQQENRINQAVRDLEHSEELNDNRRIYRSTFLLDQDRAIRAAGLASIYIDAGLTEVAIREAARAVSADYASYSAHLFLADSYDALRDPAQVNLRYETPWLNEYLLANLLAPAAAGVISPTITQQEYGRLFEQNRIGLASITEYTSRGDWSQAAAQFGIYGNSAYSAEVAYRSANGDWPNGSFEQTSLNLRLKHDLTTQDRLYAQIIAYDATAGDAAQRYDPNLFNPDLHTHEQQEPIALIGYDREWAPGNHTLLLAGRLADDLHVRDPRQQTFFLERGAAGQVTNATPVQLNEHYRSEFDAYTIEVQQIVAIEDHTVVAGARYQDGTIDTEVFQNSAPGLFSRGQDVSTDFSRFNIYAYENWRIARSLLVVGGISYDRIEYPENFRFAPVSNQKQTRDQVSPKAGLIWTPLRNTTVRGAYARALGGVSFDQSFQLEPSQVAGFNQAFRSVIPESAAGSVSAESFDMAALSLEQKFSTGTYAGLSGQWLESDAHRNIGVVEEVRPAASTPQALDYRERSLNFYLYQLLGEGWSTGLRYRFSFAELNSRLPGIPAAATAVDTRQNPDSGLHQLDLFALYNHPSGFFGELDGLWVAQANSGYAPALSDESFWQLNTFLGYRFPQRRAEVRAGILNLTDQNYRLSPLNLTAYIPRERTFTVSLKFFF